MKENNKTQLNYSESVVAQITARCTEVETGARNIDYILNANIFPKISRELLAQLSTGEMPTEITLDLDDNQEFSIEFTE